MTNEDQAMKSGDLVWVKAKIIEYSDGRFGIEIEDFLMPKLPSAVITAEQLEKWRKFYKPASSPQASAAEVEKAARLRRDQTMTVLCVLAGAPMDNLPEDIQELVVHWIPAIRKRLAATAPKTEPPKCSVCGEIGADESHAEDCYASDVTKLMDKVDAAPPPQASDAAREPKGMLQLAGTICPFHKEPLGLMDTCSNCGKIEGLLERVRAETKEEDARIAERTPFRAHAESDVDFHSGCVQTRERIAAAIRASKGA
jgi:hypothetical protein